MYPATWKYFKGTEEPSTFPYLEWTEEAFDDASWLSGTLPIWYDSGVGGWTFGDEADRYQYSGYGGRLLQCLYSEHIRNR